MPAFPYPPVLVPSLWPPAHPSPRHVRRPLLLGPTTKAPLTALGHGCCHLVLNLEDWQPPPSPGQSRNLTLPGKITSDDINQPCSGKCSHLGAERQGRKNTWSVSWRSRSLLVTHFYIYFVHLLCGRDIVVSRAHAVPAILGLRCSGGGERYLKKKKPNQQMYNYKLQRVWEGNEQHEEAGCRKLQRALRAAFPFPLVGEGFTGLVSASSTLYN